MSKLNKTLSQFVSDDSGATMVEYALMVALVAAVCVVAVTALGTAISAQFTSLAGNL